MTAVRMTTRIGLGTLLVSMSCAALTMPAALADPETTEPATPSTSAAPAAPAAPAGTQPCTGEGMMNTISSVTDDFADYLGDHPDASQALIDITRQPAFVAMGQMDGYFGDHPDQANDLRAIQAPLAEFKDRCGLQVSPTDALTVLSEI